jgi:hypothetical protein
MSTAIELIDKNFAVETKVTEPDLKFYDPRKSPFKIYGLYKPETEDVYKRMPTEIANKVSESVATLHKRTAGGRIRFATDSRYIVINAKMPVMSRVPHNPLTGTSSFDLYVDDENGAPSRFFKPFIPPYDSDGGYESLLDFGTRKLRYVTICFPSYASVSELFIGLQEDAIVKEGLSYRDMKPIVYYGSSITQGACSSRAGNIYQNIICRRNNIDYINLGFSGACKAEDVMIDYLCTLDSSIFVMDYDHNAPSCDHLRATHKKLYSAYRAAHPDTPIIMISMSDVYKHYESCLKRRDIIMATYLSAREAGDTNVYFVDGMRTYPDELYDDCMVDHCHPTDLGMSYMASSIGTEISRILTKDNF